MLVSDGNSPEIWGSIWEQNADAVVLATRKELAAYEASESWQLYSRLVKKYFGGWSQVSSIEVGAGSARHSNLAALRGANATILDYSPQAIEIAKKCFSASDAQANFIQADAFELPPQLVGNFNLVWSFGTAEHFIEPKRHSFIAKHVELLANNGLLVLAVPNKYCLDYRLYMALAKRYREWQFGLEVPFSRFELENHLARLGISPVEFMIQHNPWFRWQTLDLIKRRVRLIYPFASIIDRATRKFEFPHAFTSQLNYEAIMVGYKG